MTTGVGQIVSGLNALMDEYSAISHNIANNNTSGFKRRINSFSAELARLQGAGEKGTPLSGEVSTHSSVDFSQGAMVQTGRALDVAFCGKGFLTLETPDGPVYTRNGSLELNDINQLVDLNGFIVAGDGGPIVLPSGTSISEVSISEQGVVSAGQLQLGKMKLADFGDDQSKLTPAGAGTFTMPDPQVDPQEATSLRVKQGYQEGSNVKMVEEMVNMMTVSRLYETSVQMLRKQRDNNNAMLEVAKS